MSDQDEDAQAAELVAFVREEQKRDHHRAVATAVRRWTAQGRTFGEFYDSMSRSDELRSAVTPLTFAEVFGSESPSTASSTESEDQKSADEEKPRSTRATEKQVNERLRLILLYLGHNKEGEGKPPREIHAFLSAHKVFRGVSENSLSQYLGRLIREDEVKREGYGRNTTYLPVSRMELSEKDRKTLEQLYLDNRSVLESILDGAQKVAGITRELTEVMVGGSSIVRNGEKVELDDDVKAESRASSTDDSE